jgi:peroxiredoxin
MNTTTRLKSFFVTPYLTFAAVLGLYALYRGLSGPDPGWLGVALTTLPLVSVVAVAMAFRRIARTRARMPVLVALGGAGVGLSAYAYVTGASDAWALSAALVGFGLFLLYDLWYSDLGREPSAVLEVGRRLPVFTVEDEDGARVRADRFFGGPTLFLFYRGNWCPFCMAQVGELAAQYEELVRRGVSVVLISPQPHGHTRALARKFDLPFHFLVDVDNRAAEALGIVARGGLPLGLELFGYETDTVLPTVILTDAEGVVRWVDETDNYRVRPEPETFLRVLDARLTTA